MKNILFIFVVSFSILINAQTDPNLKWMHASPQGQDLKWMKMFDANNWYFGGQGGMFMKTTDAGQTWTTNNRAGWPHTEYPGILSNWQANAAWFFDQNNGILGGSNTSGILKTTDGGETFDTLRILPGSNSGKSIYSIYFVNSNLGFISGNTDYKIQKTTDGGATWSELPNLIDPVYNDVYASDELNIIACGESGKVYKTTDGGASWNVSQLGTLQPLYDLEFVNSTTGYVCGGVGYFHYTTDGGISWSGGANTPSSYSNYKIKAINNEIYIAGDYTKLFKSTDNGLTWSTFNLPGVQYYSGFSYCMDVIGSNIIAAGRYGNIYRSTNSGTDWNLLTQKVTDASFLRSFYVENTSGKIIVAGRYGDVVGTIIISDDGGNTWYASPQTIPFDNLLQKMQMFDNNNGYFSGQYGYFAKTTDGGLSLTQIVIPFVGINFLYDMDFLNQSTGWVVGGIPNGGGVIAKTTDGGLTWTDQTPVGITAIGRVDFVDASIGYISYAGGLRKTTNGGSSWNTITIPGLIGGINCITAFDANNVYINTSQSEFFKTTNGGANWQSVPVPFAGNGIYDRGQAWYDMNHGIIYGVFGAIAKTTDAGLTWETMNTGGESIAGGIMVHPDTFYVGSFQYAQIFRYAKPSAQTTFQLSVNVANGWNMVSTPGLNSPDQNVSTWWPHKTGTVWGFNGVQYVAKTVTTPGEGYWMKNTVDETYNYPAIQIVSHNPVPATLGWNMIGGYETSPSIANLKLANPQITGTVWGFNGVQYVAAVNLVPGYAYWVKVTSVGNITIPEVLHKGNEVVELFKEDWGRIILTDAENRSYTLYAVDGEVDLNNYELPPLPPAGNFDIRYGSGRIAEDLSNSQSIEMQGIAYPVKVKVENMNITLENESGKEIHAQLKSGEEITIDNKTINKLTVTSGELIAPIEYTLEQNYPNPFNPSTTIKFSLPEATDVTVTIYNTIGEKVTELVNAKLDAGRYSYQWNANNVATGMYIYELRTSNFVSFKKMILLK